MDRSPTSKANWKRTEERPSPSYDLNELLLDKALPPLYDADKRELERIQNLVVKGFTEADVRAEIIDPILRILGYRKGDYFSVDRAKHIFFADKTARYIDYNITLWQRNFWLIEAKKPIMSRGKFRYKEIRQAATGIWGHILKIK